jgi:hypothetical protein
LILNIVKKGDKMRKGLLILVAIAAVSFGASNSGLLIAISPSYGFGINTAPVSLGVFNAGIFAGYGFKAIGLLVGYENISASASYGGIGASGNTSWLAINLKIDFIPNSFVSPLLIGQGRLKLGDNDSSGGGGGGLGIALAFDPSVSLDILANFDAYGGASTLGPKLALAFRL